MSCAKIIRVLRKQDETAPHSVLLVLDATTGQNAVQQVRVFKEMVDVTGLVVTKLDGSARGGIVVALAETFGLPVHAVGVGEKAERSAAVRCGGFRAGIGGDAVAPLPTLPRCAGEGVAHGARTPSPAQRGRVGRGCYERATNCSSQWIV